MKCKKINYQSNFRQLSLYQSTAEHVLIFETDCVFLYNYTCYL